MEQHQQDRTCGSNDCDRNKCITNEITSSRDELAAAIDLSPSTTQSTSTKRRQRKRQRARSRRASSFASTCSNLSASTTTSRFCNPHSPAHVASPDNLISMYSLVAWALHKVVPHEPTPLGIAYDERMSGHKSTKGNHPERPARTESIYNALEREGLVSNALVVRCREATAKEVLSVHTNGYLNKLRQLEKKKKEDGGEGMTDDELVQYAFEEFNSVYLNTKSFFCARIAAGGVINSVNAVLQGECSSCVAVVRPPGHHAESHCAMGFCIFNNVAIAAATAVKSGRASRVLIVDWDIHHGNGTQRIFLNDPNVLYFSVHRYDYGTFYPGGDGGTPGVVGKDKGAGYTVNVAWNGGGMGDVEYTAVWRHILMPIARAFNPDLVIVSAGFDAAAGDPLGGCEVTPQGYAHMTHELLTLASGRLVLALEGGYHLQSISSSCVACVHEMVNHHTNKTNEPTETSRQPPTQATAIHPIPHLSPKTPTLQLSRKESPISSPNNATSDSTTPEILSLPAPAVPYVDNIISRTLVEVDLDLQSGSTKQEKQDSSGLMASCANSGSRQSGSTKQETRESSGSMDSLVSSGGTRRRSSKNKKGKGRKSPNSKGHITRRRASTDWEVSDAIASIRPQARHAILATRRAHVGFWPVLSPSTPMPPTSPPLNH